MHRIKGYIKKPYVNINMNNISEVKNKFLEAISSWLGNREELINRVEYIAIGTIQNEAKLGKNIKSN